MLVWAVSFLQIWKEDQSFQIVELFAGAARLGRLARSLGLKCAVHDILMDKSAKQRGKSAMDFNLSAGFVLPGAH